MKKRDPQPARSLADPLRALILATALVLLVMNRPWQQANLLDAAAGVGVPLAYAMLALLPLRRARGRVLATTVVVGGFGAYFLAEYLQATAGA